MVNNMSRFRYVYVLAALFLLLGMGVQAYVSYSRARFRLLEKMDLEMQIAQEKLRFELYDAFDALSQIKDEVGDCLTRPEQLFDITSELIERYPNFYSCYVAFPPYAYPQKGKWCGLASYRSADTIISGFFGDPEHDYFEREWYKGAIQCSEGYWSTPYRDEDFDEPIYTYSNDYRDEAGNLICVIGIDFSLKWIHNLLDQFKPFEEAVFMLYSSNGALLAASDGAPQNDALADGSWVVSNKTLQPININMVTAVPRSLIIQSLRLGTLLPLGVFLLGILVVSLLIRRLSHDERENTRLETERQVMSHELQIAHDIQMGILKNANANDNANAGIELHTLLVPMREVGGDFYDYHRNGDTLWFIIGDVSGKGVPAAIFMSAAVNLFRAAGERANSPKQIMQEMNVVLSENNPSLTFITAFVGRLSISTGELLYCNAGHCPPIMNHESLTMNPEPLTMNPEPLPMNHEPLTMNPEIIVPLRPRTLPMNPNIPLGYDGRYSFVEQGCMLAEGDTLILYTDGVTEARNSQREMLGLKRWIDIIASSNDLPQSIQHFMGTAEPTDDITLMTIRKTGPVSPVSLTVPCHEDQWPVLKQAIHTFGLCVGMDNKALKQFEVAAEEATVNILHYSHASEIDMTLTGQRQSQSLTITLQDDGLPFDPTAHLSNDKATDERQVGGMGIHLIRQIVDQMHYERREEKNILTLVKLLNS